MKLSLYPLYVMAFFFCYYSYAENISLNTPRLKGLDNFRDIAGTDVAYSTLNNGVMRAGIIYRSNELTPKGNDLAELKALNITSVIDLRAPSEIVAKKDILPEGADYTNVDILGDEGVAAVDIKKINVNNVDAIMEAGERAFVTEAFARKGTATFLQTLATTDDITLFHCTAGKDRTGWISAILQRIAGVSDQDIMHNYLASNDYSQNQLNAILSRVPESMKETIKALMSVRANWLQAGLEQIVTSYGSMDNYLQQGLGLDLKTFYILRGKMVRYDLLPGEADLRGNAAHGAALLNRLQDSSLSGRDTAYNYYLQNAVAQGNLAGLDKSVGGQVYADATSYLLRQPSRLYDSLTSVISAKGLSAEQFQFWMQSLSGYSGTEARREASASHEHTQGAIIGMTYRTNMRSAVNGGVGYSHGSVSSAGGNVKTNTTSLHLGGRYGWYQLEKGPWVGLQGSVGYIDNQSKRYLSGGLGVTRGDSDGHYYSARAIAGWQSSVATLTIDPTIAMQITRLNISDFREKGSELALNMTEAKATQTSFITNVEIGTLPQPSGQWMLTPGINVGYERMLNHHPVNSRGSIYNIGVKQTSAFSSQNLYKAGLQLRAGYKNAMLEARVNYLSAKQRSDGVIGTANFTLTF